MLRYRRGMVEHYFSPQPQAAAHEREIEVELRGHTVTVTTASAVFSADRLDKATRILLDEVPDPPAAGAALDLGCGWGSIALSLALDSPGLDVWAVDVNERALDLTARNASRLGLDRVRAVPAEGVPGALEFDVIWSNPPVRIGKQALDALLTTWLVRLRVGGEAWLVVGKNLGADSLVPRLQDALGDGFVAERASTSGGFRILRVERVMGSSAQAS